jgi:signal transduction histidine kinase
MNSSSANAPLLFVLACVAVPVGVLVLVYLCRRWPATRRRTLGMGVYLAGSIGMVGTILVILQKHEYLAALILTAFWVFASVLGFLEWRKLQRAIARNPAAAAEPLKIEPFFWEGLLILLPVVLLTGIGIWTLKRDRAAVEAEARGRAEALAGATLSALETYFQQLEPLVPSKGSNSFFVSRDRLDYFFLDSSNRLSGFGAPWPPVPKPLPPATDGFLGEGKAGQWNAAETAFGERDWSRAAELYGAFLAGRSVVMEEHERAGFDIAVKGVRYRGLAFFRRGLALEQLGETNDAIDSYEGVLSGAYVDTLLTESGQGLPAFCALRILNLTHDDPSRFPAPWRSDPTALAARLQADGSPVGKEVYDRLKALGPALTSQSQPSVVPEMIFTPWDFVQRCRLRYDEAAGARAGDDSSWPQLFWVAGEFPWLALEQKQPASANLRPDIRQYLVFPEDAVERVIEKMRQERGAWDYSVSAMIGSRRVGISGAEFAVTVKSAALPLAVTASLDSPAAFFAAQKRRQALFTLLLLAAAGSCVVGYFTARRAFYRQLRLSEMKSNFVSSVSHELRAPIASVRLMAEGLERGRIAEEKQRDYFKFIVQECRRLSSLIENVLDFSRIEQGRKQYELESTDLVALTEQTVKLMETYGAEKEMRIEIKRSGEAVPVEADGKAIQQALINLIDNAIKHSPKGAVITVGLESADGKHVWLWVEDHGEGIPGSEHERIFERFYRVGSELRRETQGVGIGLSIVKHIVEAHGGRVTVRSAPGQGSRFTIELPVKPQDAQSPSL